MKIRQAASVGLVLLWGSGLAMAADSVTGSIDELTGKWLQLERQEANLINDWAIQKPALEQRVALLSVEKKQLQGILKESSAARGDVEARRKTLLEQQGQLESQQQTTLRALDRMSQEVDALYDTLPDPVRDQWDEETEAAGEVDDASSRLQLLLARLSIAQRFNTQLTVNETLVAAEDGSEYLVKQLYLGLCCAWFTSESGDYKGVGRVVDGRWQWLKDSSVDTASVLQAISIYQKQAQPSLIPLPVNLQTTLSTASTDAGDSHGE